MLFFFSFWIQNFNTIHDCNDVVYFRKQIISLSKSKVKNYYFMQPADRCSLWHWKYILVVAMTSSSFTGNSILIYNMYVWNVWRANQPTHLKRYTYASGCVYSYAICIPRTDPGGTWVHVPNQRKKNKNGKEEDINLKGKKKK